MNIGDKVKFRDSLPDQFKDLGESVGGEYGEISAIETRDSDMYFNVIFSDSVEVVGIRSSLFELQPY